MILAVYFTIYVLVFANMTSAATIYMLKDNGSRNQLFKYRPLAKENTLGELTLTPKISAPEQSLLKAFQKLSKQSLDTKMNQVCDGEICIDNLKHNQRSVVINSPRREPGYRYHPSSESHSNEEDSVESFDDVTFQDLTRGERPITTPVKDILSRIIYRNKNSETERRNPREKKFSTDYIDFNDLRSTSRLIDKKTDADPLSHVRLEFKLPNNQRRYAERYMIPSQGRKLSLRSALPEKSNKESEESREDESEDESEESVSEEENETDQSDLEQENNEETGDSTVTVNKNKKGDSEDQMDMSDAVKKMHKQVSKKKAKRHERKKKRSRKPVKFESEESEEGNFKSENDEDTEDDTPKRFEIVKKISKGEKKKKKAVIKKRPKFKSDEVDNFPSSGELSNETPKKSVSKKLGHYKKEVYMQGPKRKIKAGPNYGSFRKRLQQFLPKRYHWNEDEFQKLGYFWFNGPQGYDPPGSWRVPY